MRRPAFTFAALAAAASLSAQTAPSRQHTPQPTTAAITAADLTTRLYIFSDDSMAGRQGGAEGNLKATAYIAAEVKRLGLTPAGDSGSYFQYIPLVRRAFAAAITIKANATPISAPADWLPFGGRGTPRSLDGVRVIFGGVFTDSATWITAAQAEGRLVVFMTPHDSIGPVAVVPFLRGNSRFIGAAGVALLGRERLTAADLKRISRPAISLQSSATGTSARTPQMMIVTSAAAAVLLGRPVEAAHAGDEGATLHGTIDFIETPLPARNVVAILLGSDAKRRAQYVAIGAHSDHIGIRDGAVDHDSLRAWNTAIWDLRGRDPLGAAPSPAALAAIRINMDSLHRVSPARLDSINNGADDDGSGSVGLLEIAEAAAALKPHPKRSLLFVWHTGEELGLLGSRWFADHPTVPRDSIVAQLNIDMIGRGGAADIKGGGPNYLEVIGSFRLSTELGKTAERVNAAQPAPFVIDYAFDAPGHPENIYCRSDHANYARWGIPIAFFSTGLHQDYHQVTDEPQYIDYDHLARVSQYVFDLSLALADQDARPVVDHPKPDPNAPCKQ